MTTVAAGTATTTATTRTTVLHVTRAFSALPTLAQWLGDDMVVREMPAGEVAGLPPARPDEPAPAVVWVSSPDAGTVHAARRRWPSARLLVTVPRGADPHDVVELIAHGADLVLRDEGVVLAAAAVASLARRTRPAPDRAGRA